jgi:hypothetical protein
MLNFLCWAAYGFLAFELLVLLLRANKVRGLSSGPMVLSWGALLLSAPVALLAHPGWAALVVAAGLVAVVVGVQDAARGRPTH